MRKFIATLDGLYGRLYHSAYCALSLLLALCVAAALMWDPVAFADQIGGFNAIKGPAIIYATCIGIMHGVGFKAKHWLVQLLTLPVTSWCIFALLLITAISR